MKIYTIKKNHHYSNFIPKLVLNKNSEQIFEENIIFDESCLYDIDEKSCVNKLFGFCYGIFGVHKNSVRFGWTSGKNTIYIWKYVYINGKLNKEKIFRTKIDKENKFRIIKNNNTVQLEINNKLYSTIYIDRRKTIFIPTLGFYFGGNTKAPHTMKIKVTN